LANFSDRSYGHTGIGTYFHIGTVGKADAVIEVISGKSCPETGMSNHIPKLPEDNLFNVENLTGCFD
jgi:hypothetical protein